MTVFEFIYSECIHESGAVTMSIHRTRKGAEMALDFHKQKARDEWNAMWTSEEQEDRTFGDMEYWGIRESVLMN